MAASCRQPSPRKLPLTGWPASAGRATIPTDAVFTIDELVIALKIAKRTMYTLAPAGTIPGHKVDRHRRYLRESIVRWLVHGAPSAARKRGRDAHT